VGAIADPDVAQRPLDGGCHTNRDPRNDTFVHQLAALHIPVTVDAYGNGTHDWPYWQRDLHRALPFLLKALGE